MLYQMQKTLGLYLHTSSRVFKKPWGDYQPVSFIHSKVKSTLDLKCVLLSWKNQPNNRKTSKSKCILPKHWINMGDTCSGEGAGAVRLSDCCFSEGFPVPAAPPSRGHWEVRKTEVVKFPEWLCPWCGGGHAGAAGPPWAYQGAPGAPAWQLGSLVLWGVHVSLP